MVEENSISINKYGIIEVSFKGDQTFESMKAIGQKALSMIVELKSGAQKIHALVDLSGITRVTPGSNKAALEIIQTLPYDKIAITGGSKRLHDISRMIITAAGKGEAVKVFKNREDAAAWLYEGLARE